MLRKFRGNYGTSRRQLTVAAYTNLGAGTANSPPPTTQPLSGVVRHGTRATDLTCLTLSITILPANTLWSRAMRLLLRVDLPQRPAACCADGPVGVGNPAILRSRRHLAITLEFGIEIGQSSNLRQCSLDCPVKSRDD